MALNFKPPRYEQHAIPCTWKLLLYLNDKPVFLLCEKTYISVWNMPPCLSSISHHSIMPCSSRKEQNLFQNSSADRVIADFNFEQVSKYLIRFTIRISNMARTILLHVKAKWPDAMHHLCGHMQREWLCTC